MDEQDKQVLEMYGIVTKEDTVIYLNSLTEKEKVMILKTFSTPLNKMAVDDWEEITGRINK